MKRRAAIAAGLVVLVSARSFAQKQALIALQTTGDAEEAALSVQRFREGMRERGHDSRSFRVEPRHWNGDSAAVMALARELVGLRPDVLVVSGITMVQAAKQATTSIPIVVAGASDLVSAGVAASYGRPGGNITGLTNLADVLTTKRLELLAEAMPTTRKVALLQNPAYPLADAVEKQAQKSASRLRIQLIVVRAASPSEIATAVEMSAQGRADAILVVPHALFAAQSATIVDAAMRHRIPVVHWRPEAADDGALLVQGVNVPLQYELAAKFVSRIVNGARPGDLPIEQFTQDRIIINLKTAKTLGLTLPAAVRLRANRVIE